MKLKINFNNPFFIGSELKYVSEAINKHKHLSGDGYFTKKCHDLLTSKLCNGETFLTNSCTTALEMASILLDIKEGDEIIMPSYTFVSTANAFVIHGAIPVFVDIEKYTLNIDYTKIEEAITSKTKAIVPVHYAGYPCKMDEIMEIARRHKLYVIEDAAQALYSEYKNKKLGTIGDIGCFSFHETKNIISGEGGAISINNSKFLDRAHVVWQKGTNRREFFLGNVDKYTWVDKGSSFLPNELTAAFLYAQLEQSEKINKKRMQVCQKYYENFLELKEQEILELPQQNDKENIANGHMFYLILKNETTRNQLISFLRKRQILSVFHYTPLHSSPAGKKFGRFIGDMKNTDSLSARLVRLPLYHDITEEHVNDVIQAVKLFFEQN